jgi:glycosyltransferase involved in cell wall biosynthesis
MGNEGQVSRSRTRSSGPQEDREEATESSRFVVAVFEPEAAGHHMALHVRFILREMVRRGWEVHLVTTERATKHPGYKIVEEESGESYRLHLMRDQETEAGAKDTKRVADQFARWTNYRDAYRALSREVRLDAVYMVNLDQCDMAMALRGSPFGRTPFVGMMIGRHFHCPAMGIKMAAFKMRDRIMGPVFRRLLRISGLKKVAVLDEALVQFVHEAKWKGHAKVVHVPDVASLQTDAEGRDLRRELGIPEEAFLVLSYGALSERKGVVELTRAMADARCPKEAAALYAGRQDEFTKGYLAEEPAATLRNEGRLFELNKFLDDGDEAAAFAEADAVWLGYRDWYGMSGVLVQGAAAGKPLLAMDQGLIGWLVEKHGIGVTCEIARPESVAEKIAWLREHPDEAAAFGKKGRQMAANHTPELFGRRICNLVRGE